MSIDPLALSRYQQYFQRVDSPFEELPTASDWRGASSTSSAVQRRYRVRAGAGAGWFDMHAFGDRMAISRLQCSFTQSRVEHYQDIPDTIRLSVVLNCDHGAHVRASEKTLAQPGDIRVRNGNPGPVLHAVVPDVMRTGLAIDLSRDMIETLGAQGCDLSHLGLPGSCSLLRADTPVALRLQTLGQRMMALHTDAHLLAKIELETLGLELMLLALKGEDLRAVTAAAGARAAAARRHWGVAVDDAIDILQSEWRHPPTIAELARRAGINACYLKEFFRQRTGMTIADYQRHLRMRHARDMLESGAYTLQQLAHACGYARTDKFSIAFRRAWGQSPSGLLGSARSAR
ncbi:AraC family transcriptional regulator [Corticibacter populi]|uniref:AraC family transcriptional regulator n=1 Tax=Corticibacter populi TaxID=1550736 RepID=A0A3M6QYZ5_9BURK|nr:AraC family transcriptional regulator [Corticibacter populi]RMX08246.1 AraC family transcriptional regulator [Corticibacter populi]RZS35520.1 AraC-like DNA-binding protein [Corticibacter populi]